MDLNHLRMIVAICDCSGLARAATELHVSQATLSTKLRRLEDRLGQRLFDRRRGGAATPTIFARHIAERARMLLVASENIDRELRMLASGEIGRVRLGVGPGVKSFFLPTLVREIVRRFPQLRLDLDVLPSDELYDRLAKRELDLVLGHFEPGLSYKGMVATELFRDLTLSIVRAGHPLAGRDAVSWDEALQYPHISTVRFKTYAEQIPDQFLSNEQVLTAVRTSDMDTVRILVSMGNYVALGSRFIFMDQLKSGEFVRLSVEHAYASSCAVVATTESALFPVIQKIIGIAKGVTKSVSGVIDEWNALEKTHATQRTAALRP
jgi:DNA-binding transcriptional LysR family regulator